MVWESRNANVKGNRECETTMVGRSGDERTETMKEDAECKTEAVIRRRRMRTPAS